MRIWPFAENDASNKCVRQDFSCRYQYPFQLYVRPNGYKAIAFTGVDCYRYGINYEVMASGPVRAFVISKYEYKNFIEGGDYHPCLERPDLFSQSKSAHQCGVIVDIDGPDDFDLYFLVINQTPEPIYFVWNMKETLNNRELLFGVWTEGNVNGDPRPIVGQTVFNHLGRRS